MESFRPELERIRLEGLDRDVIHGPDEQVLLVNARTGEYLKTTLGGFRLLEENDGKTCQSVLDRLDPDSAPESSVLYGFLDRVSSLGFTDRDWIPATLAPRTTRPVVEVWLNVTRRCNLRCPFCYFESNTGRADLPDDIDTEKMYEIIDLLANGRVRQVIVAGGEALVRKDIFSILGYLRSKISGVVLITNGQLLTPTTCEKLIPLVDRILVSVDGPNAEIHDRYRGPGTFDRAIAGITNLHDLGYRQVEIVPMVRKDNLPYLEDIERFAADLGVKVAARCLFLPTGSGSSCVGDLSVDMNDVRTLFSDKIRSLVDRHERAAEALQDSALPIFNEMLDLARPGFHRCGAGTSKLSIDSDGTVYPCQLMHTPECALGSIFDLSELKDLIGSAGCRELSQLTASRIDRVDECRNCDIRHFCGGGCAAANLAEGVPIEERFVYCETFRSLFSASVWQWRSNRNVIDNLKAVADSLAASGDL